MADDRPADRRLSMADRVLYHQIHPAKLGADLLAELVSVELLWQRRLRAGLAAHFIPPIVASAIVTRRDGDLVRLRDSPMGRYVSHEMTPQMQAVRLAGDGLIAIGAWCRSPGLIVAGITAVVAGWTLGPAPVDRGIQSLRSDGDAGVTRVLVPDRQ